VLCALAALQESARPVAAARAAACTFRLGFAALHDLIPLIVGDCLTDETHNPANGDGLQFTTRGLLVWRKADNWTAFTDGSTTWINGPLGLQRRPNEARFPWEANAGTQPPSQSITATGVLTTIFNGHPRYFLAIDGGDTVELDLDVALMQPSGGPRAFDRKHVRVVGEWSHPSHATLRVLSIVLE
jgi:hypothetical protein